MKKIFAVLSICSVFTFYSCSNSVESNESNEDEVTSEKVTYVANDEVDVAIEGMMCSMGCKGAIEKELNQTAGIAECNVDFENGSAHIAFNNEIISQEEIINTISNVNDGAYEATLKEEASELKEPLIENSNS